MLGGSLQREYIPGTKANIDQGDCGNNLELWGSVELAGWNVGWQCALVCPDSDGWAPALQSEDSGLARAA